VYATRVRTEECAWHPQLPPSPLLFPLWERKEGGGGEPILNLFTTDSQEKL